MRKPAYLRLGVNIDHVATIRNARGGRHPDPVRAAHLAVEAGADGITAHLREDRRHISDDDIARLKAELTRPLNLEMAATDEMLAIALRHLPQRLLPRARAARGAHDRRRPRRRRRRRAPCAASSARCKDAGIRVSLFIEPDAARRRGFRSASAPTSSSCTPAPIASGSLEGDAARGRRASSSASPRRPRLADAAGLEVHAGHGLTFDTVGGRRAPAADRRAQHRPLPHRRGDLRRPVERRAAHARADGRSAPRMPSSKRQQARSA